MLLHENKPGDPFFLLFYYNIITERKRQKKNTKILGKEICTLCKLPFFQVYKKSAP